MKKKKPFLIALALIAASLTGCTIASAPESNANKPSDDSSQGIHDEVYVNSIEVIKNPTQMDYVPGEESFNPDGIVLKATWSDGYVEEVGSQKIYYEPMGILSDEDSTITIYYGDASTTLNILTDSSFELYILTPPLKTDYISGEIFDPKGIVLGYKNPLTGKTKEIKGFNALDVSYSTNTLSTKDTFVTITYKNKQVNVPINVRNKAIQIELEDQSRVSYFGGAMPKSTVLFDAVNNKYYLAGDKNKSLYSTYQEAWDKWYASASAASKAMVQYASGNDFVATLDDKDRGFTINVNVEKAASYRLFIRGASNDLDNNPPTESYDMNIKDKLTLTSNGKKVEINSHAVLKGKKDTKPNYSLFTNWYTAYINTIDLNAGENTLTFTTFGNGEQKGGVSWKCYGQYDYVLLEEVVENEGEIVSLSLNTSEVNTKYYEGETFTSNGLKVFANYQDGTKEEVYDYSIAMENQRVSRGDHKIEVSYKGKTAQFDLAVIPATAIELNSDYTNEYIEGQNFDQSKLKVKVTYQDGEVFEDFKGYELIVDSPLKSTSHEFTVKVGEATAIGSLIVRDSATQVPETIEFENKEKVTTTGGIQFKSDSASTDLGKWILTQASGGDFLSIAPTGSTISISIDSQIQQNAELVIRASSSYFLDIVNWKPSTLKEVKLADVMVASINENNILLDETKILPGAKKEDFTNPNQIFANFIEISLGVVPLNEGKNTLKFTFKLPDGKQDNEWKNAYNEAPNGQYDYLKVIYKGNE